MSLLRLYADDTTGYYSDTSPAVLQFVVNSELSLLSFWFDQNRLLVVNNDKTQAGADVEFNSLNSVESNSVRCQYS